jgi:glucose/arabinose dehydrogenase
VGALAALAAVAASAAAVLLGNGGSGPGGSTSPSTQATLEVTDTGEETVAGVRPQERADCRSEGTRTTVLAAREAARAEPLLRLRKVADELVTPLYVVGTPSEPDRLYVVQQTGRVVVVENGQVGETPFLDLVGEVDTINEDGLLSVAFHPDYSENRLFYVVYNDIEQNLRLVEYRAGTSGALADSARELLRVDKVPDVTWHNGGQLQFGPDGMLYVAFGDSAHTPLSAPPAPRTDPDNQAQDPSTRYGKLFRLDVAQEDPEPELLAYGLRNPWRFSFDPANGDLYIADVGFHVWEEIDYLPGGTDEVVNFGWSPCEGPEPFRELDASDPNMPPNPLAEGGRLTAPVLAYRHESPSYCEGRGSVTGGYVYRGNAVPALRGRYVFGDYCSGEIWTLRMRNGRAVDVRTEDVVVESLSSFGVDADGELYAVSLDGQIYRLEARS